MRNSAQNTRRITAVTLAVALGVAVYLNWEYAKADPVKTVSAQAAGSAVAVAAGADSAVLEASAGSDALEASAASDGTALEASADSALTVSDGLMTEEDTLEAANKNYGEAQLVSISKDSGSEFFEQARLDRTKTRDSAVDDIEKSLKKSSLSDKEKEDLTAKLTAYLQDITKENEIETLVKAKGFADCLCILQDGKADLTVMTSSGDGLNASQVAQIRDIVLKKCTGLSAQDITVVEVK
ncbi:MAG: SpoIIIAH-like family protein [Faecalibacterium sp.]|jgi:stage III sporulation protein AH|nr:SpoIIIAH-like family protein [Faecalibacterium sp.]